MLATEGEKLSGVQTDKDCKQIGLWRRSYIRDEGRRGNAQQRESLRQKDKGNTTDLRNRCALYFCEPLCMGRFVCFIIEGEELWNNF